MLGDPSDREDCLPHEAPRRSLADLTKLPTRLPFRTSILSKSSETTHSVLPQNGQSPSHPSTTQSGPGNRRSLQSIASIPRCPLYVSPETSYGNQSPLKPFTNPPSQNLAPIPTTSSRDTRLPLRRPIATTSQLSEQPYPKSSRLSPPPARLFPLTDPNKTKNLWAMMRKQIANTRAISSAGKQKAGKGTFRYELESRKITITASSLQPVYEWLPPTDQASGQELGGLYLETSSNFASEIQDWALCFSTFDPPMSEYQWATDVFAKFLPVQIYPPRSKKDSIKLRRQQQPYVSITLGDYVLLPPKDLQLDSVSTNASQKLGLIKRKKGISTLPRLDTKDGFGLNEPTEGSTATRYKEDSSSRVVKLDFMYASSISLLKDYALYTQYPAIRTFASIDLLPPYIIGEFKNTKKKGYGGSTAIGAGRCYAITRKG